MVAAGWSVVFDVGPTPGLAIWQKLGLGHTVESTWASVSDP